VVDELKVRVNENNDKFSIRQGDFKRALFVAFKTQRTRDLFYDAACTYHVHPE